MRTLIFRLLFLAALLSFNCFGQSYQLTDLGAQIGANSYAQGINNQGQVVGYWNTTNGAHAFLYQSGSVTDLGLLGLGATNNYALSVNNLGQVVGFSETTNGSRAFIYQNGAMTNLGSLGGLGSYAFGINGNGQIVGYIDTTNGARAILYGNGAIINIGTLGGTNSYAYGINNALQVAGSSLLTNNATMHAFLWQNGAISDLNQYQTYNSGWQLIDAHGINDLGNIVGWGVINNQEHAYLYSGSGIAIDLGVLTGGTNSYALGLNNSNQVVGASSSSAGFHAVFWQNGVANDLNNLIHVSGWELKEACGINDLGQIVGWGVIGGQAHAFLLTYYSSSPSGSSSSKGVATMVIQALAAPAALPPSGSLTVSITNPVTNASFPAPTNLTINAISTDSAGTVTQMQFFVGTRLLGITTNSSYSLIWSNPAVGIHALTAVAWDNVAQITTSSVVNVIITTNLLPIADAHVRDGSSTNLNFGTTNVMECLTTSTNGNNRDIYFKFDLTGLTNISSAKLNVFARLGGAGTITNTVYSVTNTSWLETNITWNNKPARVTALATNSITGTNWYQFDVTTFIKTQKNLGSNIVSVAMHDPTNFTLLMNVNSKENTTNRPSLVIVTTNSPLSISITNPASNSLYAAPANIAINASVSDGDGSVTQVQYFQGATSLGIVTGAPYNLTWSNVAFGTYALTASAKDSSGLVSTSSIVNVIVDTPPSITLQPTNQAVKQGSNAVFTVTAAGTAPLSYQWWFNVTNKLAAATNTSLTIANVQSTNTGNYTVIVTNVVGTVTSSNASLALLVVPSITTQPTNQMATQGSNVTFSVTATGTAPLTYQWRFNTTNLLAGATNSALTLTNVQSANAGNYSVVVTNLYGSVTSSNAALTVRVPPSITLQPTNQTVKQGSNAVFTVTAAGTAPLSYQWWFNGTNKLAAGTNTTLTITNVQSTNVGNYTVIVTNVVGSVTSSNANLALLVAPSITTQPTNQTTTQGSNVTFSVTAAGTAPFSYQWRFNTTNLLSGATNSSLALTNVQSTNAGSYSVVVTNLYGSVTSSNATLTVLLPPSITLQPTNQTVKQGSNAVLAVTAAGTAPLSYQWWFNGTNKLAAGTNTTLTITNVQLTNTGNYTVIVTNAVGSVTSSIAILAFPAAPLITTQPTNQTVTLGNNVTLSAVAVGTSPLSYQWFFNGTNLASNMTVITTVAGNGTAGYSGDGGAATNASLHSYPVGVAVAVDAFGNLFIADTGNNVIRKMTTNGIINTVVGNGTAGYSGNGGAATNASLNNPFGVMVDTFGNLFIADSGNNVIRKVAANGIITTIAGNGTAAYAGDGGAATNASLNNPFGVMVDTFGNLFIADSGNNVIRKVATNGIITTIAGNGTAAYAGDGGAATNASLNYPPGLAMDTGGNLFIADNNNVVRKVTTNGIITTVVGNGNLGYSGDGGAATNASMQYPFGLALDASGNLFLSDELNNVIRKVATNGIITTVVGNGTAGYSGDGGAATNASLEYPLGIALDVSGNLFIGDFGFSIIRRVNFGYGNQPTLVLNNVTLNQAGSYSVVVTNLYGSVTSSNAVLTVLASPTIVTQPTNQTVALGGSVTFSVAATGTAPLNYQWWFNSTNMLSGATSSSLTLNNLQSINAGNYSVVVSNFVGSMISSNILLAVDIPPSISISNPTNNAILLAGSSISLGATASDTDGAVVLVRFFQGTTSLGTMTAPPFTLAWSNVPVGIYALTAQATDNNGIITTSAVVNIVVDTSPVIAITNPANDSIFIPGSNISLNATASDAVGVVTKVQFFFGTNCLGTLITPPYNLTWSNLAVGIYSVTAQATDNYGLMTTSPATAFYVSPLTNMVAWWRAEGNALDCAGTNNGILQGGVTFTNGEVGQAFNFDGASGFVATSVQLTSPQDFTLELWFKTTTTQGGALMGFGDSQSNSSAGYDRNLYMGNDGRIHWGIYTSGTVMADSTASYNDGSWHHVAATLSSSVGSALYLDGVLVATNQNATPASSYPGWWRIGENNLGGWPDGSSSFYFNGLLDEVTIYNSALSATAVQSIYNAGSAGKIPGFNVALTNPVNNAVVIAGSNISLGASATDPVGIVTQVQMFQGNTSLGNSTTPPFNLTLTNPAIGAYAFTAVASDNNGFFATSSVVNVVVDIPPSVSLTNPVNNIVYPAGSNISLGATASDADGTVSRIQFFQGTNNLGFVTNYPYNLVWSNAASGIYSFSAVASDNNGLCSTSSTVSVTVEIPPVISITSPANSSMFVSTQTNIILSAAASDTDGNVASVQFLYGGISLGIITNAPYSLIWSNVTTGNYTLTAVAVDNLGLATTSSVVGFTVAPMAVVITNPANNSVYIASSTNITLNAVANDVIGTVTQVQYFQGLTSLGVISNSPYSLVWSNVSAGTYSLTAVAVDNNGNAATSSVVNLTVTPLFATNNLSLWLKGDAINGLTNNAAIAVWPDSSGWNNNATQNNGNNQPVYFNNVINGYPVVRFNGENSYFNLPNFLNGATGVEAFVVLKAVTNRPAANSSLWQLGSAVGGGGKNGNGYPALDGSLVEDFGSQSFQYEGVPAQDLTQYHLYEVSSQSNNFAAWVNGSLQYQTGVNAVGFANGNEYQGGSSLGYFYYSIPYEGSYTGYFYGDVAEVLIFNRALTASERQTVSSYLNGKYGLVPAVPATPTNLVATAVSSTQIGLTWDAVLNGGATQIAIERSTTSNGVYQVVAQISDATSYMDTNLTVGTTYYYEVQAMNLTQWSPTSNLAQATTTTNGANLPLGSLAIWLKADTGLVQGSTNTPVNLWTDQSGNGNNALQTSRPNQPVWVPGAIGDRPVVRFNGTNSYFNLPNFLNGATGVEAFVVLKAATNRPAANSSLWQLGSAVGGGGKNGNGYPALDGSLVEDFGSQSFQYEGVPAQDLTQYHMYEVSSQSNNFAAWVNGSLQYQTGINAVGFAAGNQYQGGSSLGYFYYSIPYEGSYTGFFHGDVAEVLIFSRALTMDEKITVGNYLFSKYNLYSNATNTSLPSIPTNLVANGVSPYQLNLQWTSTNAMGFNLERKMGTNGTYQVVSSFLGNIYNYLDTNVVFTNQYFYRIKAKNYFGQSGYSAEISPPVVSLSFLSTNGYVSVGSTNYGLVVQALDPDNPISQVTIVNALNLSVVVATSTSVPYVWSPPFFGTYTLQATAVDTAGNSWFSAPVTATAYQDSNGDGIPDILQVQSGNDPMNPWIPPAFNTNDHTAPVITLLIPTNAVIVP